MSLWAVSHKICFPWAMMLLPLLLLVAVNRVELAPEGPSEPHLQANPPIVDDFGSVSVSWRRPGSAFEPAPGDYVSYACGPTTGIGDYIFRCMVNSSESGKSGEPALLGGHPPRNTGDGRCWFFSLVNLRCNYTFAYVRNTGNGLTVLAAVTVPVAPGRAAPSQGHLSLGDTDDEMFVSWVSGSQRRSKVRYGIAPGAYTHSTTTYEHASTYSASEVCNSPANTTSQSYWRFPGYFHHVLLQGLTTATRYFYRFGKPIRDVARCQSMWMRDQS